MERTGNIEIRVVGKRGAIEITPETYDISEIIAVIQNAESLLFPGGKKGRPIITYEINKGSVKHIFTTALQAVIGFNAILLSIQEHNFSIDFLETPTAKAFEFFQEAAKKQDVSYEITTSVSKPAKLTIHSGTHFLRSEELWVNAEFYFYGTVTDAGGKNQANIHLDTSEFGVLLIKADKKTLGEYESNPLYKPYGIRAVGKQNLRTGEVDKGTLELVEIVDYDRDFNEKYLDELIQKATVSWEGVKDADEWISDMR